MDEQLTLKTQDKPTIFNKDMLLWGLLAPIAASFIPGVGALTATAAGHLLFQTGAMALGGTLGGAIGKSRIEKENTEGKVVKSPSIFNKTMAIGALLGGPILGLAGTAVAAAGISFATPALAIGFAVSALASFVIGGIIGGRIGKAEQQEEFNQALVNHAEQARSAALSKEPAQYLPQVDSPQISWTQKIAEKQRSAAQLGL